MRLALLLGLAGCGRLGFDVIGFDSPGGGGDSGDDGAVVDAPGACVGGFGAFGAPEQIPGSRAIPTSTILICAPTSSSSG